MQAFKSIVSWCLASRESQCTLTTVQKIAANWCHLEGKRSQKQKGKILKPNSKVQKTNPNIIGNFQKMEFPAPFLLSSLKAPGLITRGLGLMFTRDLKFRLGHLSPNQAMHSVTGLRYKVTLPTPNGTTCAMLIRLEMNLGMILCHRVSTTDNFHQNHLHISWNCNLLGFLNMNFFHTSLEQLLGGSKMCFLFYQTYMALIRG